MGKSCIRFKNTALIPYELIGLLCAKMNPMTGLNFMKVPENPKKTILYKKTKTC